MALFLEHRENCRVAKRQIKECISHGIHGNLTELLSHIAGKIGEDSLFTMLVRPEGSDDIGAGFGYCESLFRSACTGRTALLPEQVIQSARMIYDFGAGRDGIEDSYASFLTTSYTSVMCRTEKGELRMSLLNDIQELIPRMEDKERTSRMRAFVQREVAEGAPENVMK